MIAWPPNLALVLLFMAVVSIGVPSALADSSTVSVNVVYYQCSDGIDNDSDTLVDYPADPGCLSVDDDVEEDPVYACSDSLDNDGDSKIDFPADLGCDSDTDDSEADQSAPVAAVPTNNAAGGNSTVYVPEHMGQVSIGGMTSPDTSVMVMRGNEILDTVDVGRDGSFVLTLDDVTTGLQFLTLYSESPVGARSRGLSLAVFVYPDVVTKIVGIDLLPPSSSATSVELVRSDRVTDQTLVPLETGNVPAVSILSGDLNSDSRVNIIDFSMIAYWFRRADPPREADLNGDGKVDLVDFSILAFNWTS